MEQKYTSGGIDGEKLEEVQAKIRKLQYALDNAHLVAIQQVDEEIFKEELKLIQAINDHPVQEWRFQLKKDLLLMLEDQDTFFQATDCAIAIHRYLNHLKSADALGEIVEELMALLSRTSDKPVQPKGTPEQILMFIYSKALENRNRCINPSIAKIPLVYRTSEEPPNRYGELKGTVLIISEEGSGVEKLSQLVQQVLGRSVKIEHSHAQEITARSLKGVDLMVWTCEGKLPSFLKQTAKGINQIEIKTIGLIRVLEAIEFELKKHQLGRLNLKVICE